LPGGRALRVNFGYWFLPTPPRLIDHNLFAMAIGSIPLRFHQATSSPTWWFCRWWVRHSGTTNSSLFLRPIALGWAKRRWCASDGLRPHNRHSCKATNRRWVLSRWRRTSPNLSTLLSILMTVLAFKSRLEVLLAAVMSREAESSTMGGGSTTAIFSVGDWIFRGRPFGRLTTPPDAGSGVGRIGLAGKDAG